MFCKSTPIQSEATPLIHRKEKRKHIKVAAVISFLLLFVFLMFWVPYVLSGVTKWQRKEEERQKLGLYWDAPVADSHCTAHNTREYWAWLLNTVPYNYNWLKPCEDIPIVIHGRSIKTTRCYINPYVSSLIIIRVQGVTVTVRSQERCMDIGLWTLMNLYVVPFGISFMTKYV
jgi:hypothetical protein